MANPVSVTYNAEASPVAGGRIASVPMDVASTVWTPTKDSMGRIRNGSWANLPLNEWCVVSGAALNQIAVQLDAMGINRSAYDYGNSNGTIAATFLPWVGVAVDHASGNVWCPRGGGHADSSLNGVWRLNLERMGGGDGWYVERAPSDPDAAGFEWSTTYKGSGSFTVYQPYTTGSSDFGDILPDGTPTSSHTYGGVWYDPVRMKVGTSRYSRWQFDTVTKQWERGLWTFTTDPMQLYGHAHWDRFRNRVLLWQEVGNGQVGLAYDDTNPGVVVGIAMPPFPNSGISTWASCSDGDRVYFIGANASNEMWAILDIETMTWTWGNCGGASVLYSYTFDGNALVHIPEQNKLLHILSYGAVSGYRIRELDLTTKQWSAHAASGYPIVQGGNAWIHNKLFYYARRKCVVLLHPDNGDAGYCIYLMRTD